MTLIDNCESTAGWEARAGAELLTEPGYVSTGIAVLGNPTNPEPAARKMFTETDWSFYTAITFYAAPYDVGGTPATRIRRFRVGFGPDPWQNWASWDDIPLTLGQWIQVTVPLIIPTATSGTVDWTRARHLMFYGTYDTDFVIDEIEINGAQPPPTPTHLLTVDSSPVQGIQISVGGQTVTTPASLTLEEGAYAVLAPEEAQGLFFVGWNTGETSRSVTVNLTQDASLTALYEPYIPPPRWWDLEIQTQPASLPATATVDDMTRALPFHETLLQGAYTVTIAPTAIQTAEGTYTFASWLHGPTTPTIQVNLTASLLLEALYAFTPGPPPPGKTWPWILTGALAAVAAAAALTLGRGRKKKR